MIRRSKVWRAVAAAAVVIFLVVNLAGAVYAAVLGELLHAAVHAALLLGGVYGVRRVTAGPGRPWRRPDAAAASPELTARLAQLEQSVGAVAVEVERIGEGQRHVTRLFTERGAPHAAGQGDASPADAGSREPAPHAGRS